MQKCMQTFLSGHPFANQLSKRMMNETSTEFFVWVDHLILPGKDFNEDELKKKYGFVREKNIAGPTGYTPLHHPYTDLPRLLLSKEVATISCAIIVEDISLFQMVHGLSHMIEGTPFSSYRRIRIPAGLGDLLIIERRGTRDYLPVTTSRANTFFEGFEMWLNRPRTFDTDSQGMIETLERAHKLVKHVGVDMASVIFLAGERRYWEQKNGAGQVQKARQDTLGLGWANHDHHTFRSSRPNFPRLIKILTTFGFKKRERFYAGAEAGWGAQVMEQPNAGFVIFADVDLTPEDSQIDFSTQPLPELEKPGTVGLWCALHGDSILQAGMHHLEAQFNFDQLRTDLEKKKIDTMAPFSDFSYLRQAFTKGEMWAVEPQRLEKLQKAGQISKEAAHQIKTKGAVGSHLENLQRREGFKGFNQRGVSHIIKEVNPEKQALDNK